MAPPPVSVLSSAAVPLHFQHYVPESVSFISLFLSLALFNHILL
jgi:hypothetical protein